MRKDARRFKINKCLLCGYLFSDAHHVYPKRSGFQDETVQLCPNHHRYANMVQSMVEQRVSTDDIVAFGTQYFDEVFDRRVIEILINGYFGGAVRHTMFENVDHLLAEQKRGKHDR